jgi:hypothetical protein
MKVGGTKPSSKGLLVIFILGPENIIEDIFQNVK